MYLFPVRMSSTFVGDKLLNKEAQERLNKIEHYAHGWKVEVEQIISSKLKLTPYKPESAKITAKPGPSPKFVFKNW